MKKLFTFLVSAFLFITVMGQPTAFVKKATVAPVVDGYVDEVWDEADQIPINVVFNSETPTIGDSWWKMLWADDGLYVLVYVDDDVFVPSYMGANPGNSWMYDKPEIYFDCNSVKKDGLGAGVGQGHYQIAPTAKEDIVNGGTATTEARGEVWAYDASGNPKYYVEYFIPFSMLKDKDGNAVDKFKPIGFDVTIIDNDILTDNRNRMNWANASFENYANMDEAGLITLVQNDQLFKDEFADTTNWTANSGTWAVDAGVYNQTSPLEYGYNSTITGKTWDDATFEFDFKIVDNGGSENNWAGIQIRKTGPTDGFWGGSGYLIFAQADGKLVMFHTGENKGIAEMATGLTFNDWTHMKVVADGGTIQVFVAGHEQPDITVDDATFTGGFVSLITGKTSTSFDNVSIEGLYTTSVRAIQKTDLTSLKNYPNPFNTSTRIDYQLSNAGNVTLKVFDIYGREVTTLVNGAMNAGLYSATFDGSRFGRGVYFVRFTSLPKDGSKLVSKTIKMIME